MVLCVMKWEVDPDKDEAYTQWTKDAIRRTLAAPGVVEFRAYRVAAGSGQVVVAYEFADMAAWAKWYAHEDAQSVLKELGTFTTNHTTELWSPSPVVPKPIRPGA